MKFGKLYKCLLLAGLLVGVTACTPPSDEPGGDDTPEQPSTGGDDSTGNDGTVDDGDAPTFDTTIADWNGEMADDADKDVVGSDSDIYYERNSFTSLVTVTYNGSTAQVESSNSKIRCHTSGAYVTIDMQTNAVSKVEVVVRGESDNGGLKIYGEKKFKLTLDGVNLTSQKGSAINVQCKKNIFVHLPEGTTNYLTDAVTYSDDDYYLDSSIVEDRKGCFFAEGDFVFSGKGVLLVAGKNKHGVVNDGYFWMRPGVTLVVTETAKNAIHVKGSANDEIGVYIAGGLIYANVASPAGKAIKCDMDVEIEGGKLMLNTSGDAIYEAEQFDTSSAAGIKADGSIYISGGTHTMKSTGLGGKGMNAESEIKISGGETTITTTGDKYVYSANLTSSSKGVKSTGNITMSNGKLNIAVSGKSDGSEGLESDGSVNVRGGEMYVYAYDNGINVDISLSVSGGKVYAYSSNSDGIDSNGQLVVSGGVVVASGSGGSEGGIDVDNGNNFKINGGTVVACGGSLQSAPSSSSAQRSMAYYGISYAKNQQVAVLDESANPVLAFEFPRTIQNGTLFFSSPAIAADGTYTIETGGTLTDYTDSWNGWYGGGTWSGGEQIALFQPTDVVTTIGEPSMSAPVW